MTISVGIITRNREEQLLRCLDSLNKQTVKPDEIIVVDNASIDNTKKTLLLFRNKLPIRYIYEKGIGRAFARNRVLKEAKGEILAFTDDDCVPAMDWVEQIIKAHQKYPNEIATQGKIMAPSRKNFCDIIRQFYRENRWKSYESEGDIIFMDTKNASLKIKLMNKHKISFDNNFNKCSEEDRELAKQILSLGLKIIFVPKIQVYTRESPNVLTQISRRFTLGRGMICIYRKWTNKFSPKREAFWFIKKPFRFIPFCIKNHYLMNLIILFPLYIVFEIAFLIGCLFEIVKPDRFTNKPISIQKNIAV